MVQTVRSFFACWSLPILRDSAPPVSHSLIRLYHVLVGSASSGSDHRLLVLRRRSRHLATPPSTVGPPAALGLLYDRNPQIPEL
jgi:hypothetical protein